MDSNYKVYYTLFTQFQIIWNLDLSTKILKIDQDQENEIYFVNDKVHVAKYFRYMKQWLFPKKSKNSIQDFSNESAWSKLTGRIIDDIVKSVRPEDTSKEDEKICSEKDIEYIDSFDYPYFPVGLKNYGTSCYMNSAFQWLIHTPGLRQYMIHNNKLFTKYCISDEHMILK